MDRIRRELLLVIMSIFIASLCVGAPYKLPDDGKSRQWYKGADSWASYINPIFNYFEAPGGVLPKIPTFGGLIVTGTGDSWLELSNNTSFTDSLTGKYGLRFYNGALQQIINGTATDIGSASVIQRSSDPVYTDLSTGQIAVSTSSGDLFIKTSTGMYTFAGTYAADPTPPTFASASIAADGTTVTAGFSEAVSQGAGYSNTHFNLDASVTGNDIGLTYVSGSGTNSWIFTAASTILQGETVNLDFTGAANSIEDVDGTDMAAVTDYIVTNNSTQTASANKFSWDAETTTANINGGTVTATTMGSPSLSTDFAHSATHSVKASSESSYYKFTNSTVFNLSGNNTITLHFYGNYSDGRNSTFFQVYGNSTNFIQLRSYTGDIVRLFAKINNVDVYLTKSGMLSNQWNKVKLTFSVSGGTTSFAMDVNDSGTNSTDSTANTASASTDSMWIGCVTSTTPTSPMYIDDITVE